MRAKLVKTRKSKGFTQQTFAKALNANRSHYSQIETGDKEPSLKLALKIKKTLEYYNDDIFDNEKMPRC